MTAGAGSNLPECQNYSVETKTVNLSVVKGSLWRKRQPAPFEKDYLLGGSSCRRRLGTVIRASGAPAGSLFEPVTRRPLSQRFSLQARMPVMVLYERGVA